MNPDKFCILREKWRRFFDEGQRDVFKESTSSIGKAQENTPTVNVQLVDPTIEMSDLSGACASSSEKAVTSSDTAVEALPVGQVDLTEQQLNSKLESKPDVPQLEDTTRLFASCKNRREARIQIFGDFAQEQSSLYTFTKDLFSTIQPIECSTISEISIQIKKTSYMQKFKPMLKTIKEESETDLELQEEPILNEVEIDRQQILFEGEIKLEQDSELEDSLSSPSQSQSDGDDEEEDEEASFQHADTAVASTEDDPEHAGERMQVGPEPEFFDQPGYDLSDTELMPSSDDTDEE